MAQDMLQQPRIQKLVEKHKHIRVRHRQRGQWGGRHPDPDGGRARHALYRGAIAWQFTNPLGWKINK